MNAPAPGWRRLLRVGRGARRIADEVDSELAFHLQMRAEKLIAGGLDPEAARRRALQRFGDVATVRSQLLQLDTETARALGRANIMEELRQDAVYAVRALRRQPGFATVALLTLAIGIGANTAIFSLADALVLRTLPVSHPRELVAIGDPARVTSWSGSTTPRGDLFSYPTYAELERDGTLNRVFSGVLATGRSGSLDVFVGDSGAVAPSGGARAEHPIGRLVSGNYFEVLGVRARLGRTFTPADDRVAGGAPLAVVSDAFWRSALGASPGAVGRTLRVNGATLTIIGVMPPEFTGEIVGQRLDLWIPLTMQPFVNAHRDWLADRQVMWLLWLGRLAPGVSLAQARAAVNLQVPRLLSDQARMASDTSGAVLARALQIPVNSGARGVSRLRMMYRESVLTLMVAVGLVLLIICANIANLMLGRAATRQREIGVRMALGAGRGRLLRLLLTESLVLTAAGAVLGLVIAAWGRSALLRIASATASPIPLDARLDGRVLGFTIVVAAVTAILSGSVPALGATRMELAAALRAHGRGTTGGIWGGRGRALSGRRRFGAGKLLVIAQVALSLALVMSTSLLLRSLRGLERADVGLARDELLVLDLDPTSDGYEGARFSALSRDLVDRLSRLPGVRSVTVSENGLFSGGESSTAVQVPGFVARTADDSLVRSDQVGPGYVGAIGGRLVQGRDIGTQDAERAVRVAVINETMARFYFAGGAAVGQHLSVAGKPLEVVGVVADTKDHDLRAAPVRRLYTPLYQAPGTPSALSLIVRTAGPPQSLATAARRAVLAADPSLQVREVSSLSARMERSIGQDRLATRVITFFGMVALGLAAIGLYGVMAYATVRRTREFGLRLALGARPSDIARMILGETLAVVTLGISVGLPLSFAGTQLMQHQLFGIAPHDGLSTLVALVVLVAVALVAGYLPASRAARVGPLVALRQE